MEDGRNTRCRLKAGSSSVATGEPFPLPQCGGLIAVYISIVTILHRRETQSSGELIIPLRTKQATSFCC